MPHLRFILVDDDGPIRRAATRSEADELRANRPDWRLIVEPRRPRARVDLTALADAPF